MNVLFNLFFLFALKIIIKLIENKYILNYIKYYEFLHYKLVFILIFLIVIFIFK